MGGCYRHTSLRWAPEGGCLVGAPVRWVGVQAVSGGWRRRQANLAVAQTDANDFPGGAGYLWPQPARVRV